MRGPRAQKVFRDIGDRAGRSLLVVIVMAAGVFEIGALLYKYAIMEPVLGAMYGKTHPAAAGLVTDSTDDAILDAIRRVPGVADADTRPAILARVRAGAGEWKPAVFYATREFDHQRMDRFTHDTGRWPPAADEVLLERTALQVAGVTVGDSLHVRTPDGEERVVRVAGTAYAPGLPPAWMEHMVPGFVAWDSPLRDGSAAEEIRITVADHALDEGHIREVADSVKALLEREGHTVARVNVPPPGRHPHADQMDAFLYLLAAFGLVGFVLSSLLVANMTNALLTEQVRQIGILKAIGASTRQVVGIYLSQVALLAAASLVFGLPLAIAVGTAYAKFSGGILNADVSQAPTPWWAIATIAIVGIVVPVAFSLVPVLRASRLTVREALSGEVGPRPFGSRRFDRWLTAIDWLPRPLMLTLRGTFVRRGRLALTVIALAAGGAAFLSAMNLADAWTRSVRDDFARRRYDLTAVFADWVPVARVDAIFARRPEIAAVEYWPEASGYLLGPDGVPGGSVSVVGPGPAGLLDLKLLAGRAIRAGETTGAVVNQAIVARRPGLKVGDEVRVRIKGNTVAFPVVGIVKELSPMATIYATPAAVRAATGRGADRARSARIVTRRRDDAGERAAAAALESAFAAEGIEVAGLYRMLEMRQGILDHLVIILSTIGFASMLVVIVGGLGLTAALALSVLQRTREIGILGAIGATPAAIALQVWFEAMVIGLLSWVLANGLAVPVTWALESACGRIFFKTPLDFSMSATASLTWLGLVIVLSTLGSISPGLRAAKPTVREALAHA